MWCGTVHTPKLSVVILSLLQLEYQSKREKVTGSSMDKYCSFSVLFFSVTFIPAAN